MNRQATYWKKISTAHVSVVDAVVTLPTSTSSRLETPVPLAAGGVAY